MTVIGTGGIVSLFAGATNFIDFFDPDLTLDGLLEIYQHHHKHF
jgi:type III pantothenate kinase